MRAMSNRVNQVQLFLVAMLVFMVRMLAAFALAPMMCVRARMVVMAVLVVMLTMLVAMYSALLVVMMMSVFLVAVVMLLDCEGTTRNINGCGNGVASGTGDVASEG